MRIKRFIIISACIIAFNALAYSAPFSFQINQCDGTKKEISDSSLMFEDVMFGYFFDAGYTVSNLPSAITNDPEGALSQQALDAAYEGYLDYVAMIVLVYDKSARQGTSGAAQDDFAYASWKLYRVSDGAVVSGGKISTADVGGKDAETTMRNCARQLSFNLDSTLKKI